MADDRLRVPQWKSQEKAEDTSPKLFHHQFSPYQTPSMTAKYISNKPYWSIVDPT